MRDSIVKVAHRDGPQGTTERAVDQILADSFPASDPPSWTFGVTRVDALYFGRSADYAGIVAVRRPRVRTWPPRSVSLRFIGIALLIPFALLVVRRL